MGNSRVGSYWTRADQIVASAGRHNCQEHQGCVTGKFVPPHEGILSEGRSVGKLFLKIPMTKSLGHWDLLRPPAHNMSPPRFPRRINDPNLMAAGRRIPP